MAKFLTKLVCEKDDGKWVLFYDLGYQSDKYTKPIWVPMGFKTDFASVPRIPVAYWLFGDQAHEAAVVHDYLYVTGDLGKDLADSIFLEAMEVSGVWAWRRWPMYWGVKYFGHHAYDGYRKLQHG